MKPYNFFGWSIALLSLLIFLTVLSGCGHKKEKVVPASQEQAQQVELPVLPQNLLYINNREAPPPEADYSFHEFSDDLQPIPDDAAPVPAQD